MSKPLRRFRSYRFYVRTMPWLVFFYGAMFIGGFCVALLTRGAMTFADLLAQLGFAELLARLIS